MDNKNSANRVSADASLGIYTKSSPPPLSPDKISRLNRAVRYELLASARSLMIDEGHKEGLEHPHNWHRTAKCRYVNIGQVSIHKSIEHKTAFFGGLMTCGNVWACPVCSAKVQERRREEICRAVVWSYEASKQAAMVTLTFPHTKNEKLEVLLKKQADALARFRRGSPWTRFKNKVGFAGLIRALELTYGSNGWHPHTHELWFVSGECNVEDEKDFIISRWLKCCIEAGLVDPSNEVQIAAFKLYSVDIKDRCDSSDYLAKNDDAKHWGVDREIAKATSKQGKAAGLHPFGLLALARDGDKKSGALFVEFSKTMKGKRQLFWSHGLKKTVGIDDITDEEIADKKEDDADLLGLLTTEQWRVVRGLKMHSQILDAAELGGWAAVIDLVINAEKLLKNAATEST